VRNDEIGGITHPMVMRSNMPSILILYRDILMMRAIFRGTR